MVAHGTVDRRDEAITNPPCTLTIGRVPVCRQRTTCRVLRLWSLAPSTNILAWWAARLALVFGSLGTRGSLSSFFGTFGWLLGVLLALFAHELPSSSRLGLAVQRITVSVVPPSCSR